MAFARNAALVPPEFGSPRFLTSALGHARPPTYKPIRVALLARKTHSFLADRAGPTGSFKELSCDSSRRRTASRFSTMTGVRGTPSQSCSIMAGHYRRTTGMGRCSSSSPTGIVLSHMTGAGTAVPPKVPEGHDMDHYTADAFAVAEPWISGGRPGRHLELVAPRHDGQRQGLLRRPQGLLRNRSNR